MAHRKCSLKDVCKGRRGTKLKSENNIGVRGWWYCTNGENGAVAKAVRSEL